MFAVRVGRFVLLGFAVGSTPPPAHSDMLVHDWVHVHTCMHTCLYSSPDPAVMPPSGTPLSSGWLMQGLVNVTGQCRRRLLLQHPSHRRGAMPAWSLNPWFRMRQTAC